MNDTNSDITVFRNLLEERFAVILAGGDGVRMRAMTKRLAGRETPKQFCAVLGDKTLLKTTEDRIALTISAEKTFYSLTQTHEQFYGASLRNMHRKNKVIQPVNRGTAPAILYSLLRLEKFNPNGSIAFFPSDHYVSDDAAFMNHVETAFETVAKSPEAVVLMGIEPHSPKGSYGWIEPCENPAGESDARIQGVKRFIEKPTSAEAEELMQTGCVWNSFVMIGKVKGFLNLYQKHLPALYRLFCIGSITIGTSAERITMSTIYKMIGNSNFSFDVLAHCSENLRVLRSSGFEWSDLGEPDDVLSKMIQLGLKNNLFPTAA